MDAPLFVVLVRKREVVFSAHSNKKEKQTSRMGYLLSWYAERDSLAFSLLAKIEDRLGRALAGNSPPDCCI